jgi:hypothetical protein
MNVEKDWEARFIVPPSSGWRVIGTIFAFFATITLLLFFPLCIFLVFGLLPALSVSFIMRKLGLKPFNALGIAAITIGVGVTLFAWWMVTWGNKPAVW